MDRVVLTNFESCAFSGSQVRQAGMQQPGSRGGGVLGKGGGAWGGGERADNGLENSAKRRMSPAWSILMHW